MLLIYWSFLDFPQWNHLDVSLGKITGCAAGREPDYQKTRDGGNYYATFDKSVCENYSLIDECRINLRQKHGSLGFSEKIMKSAGFKLAFMACSKSH